MKRTLARWMAEKQAMDRVEKEAVEQLTAASAETRREGLATLLAISKEKRPFILFSWFLQSTFRLNAIPRLDSPFLFSFSALHSCRSGFSTPSS
jgi:hypothetical protein